LFFFCADGVDLFAKSTPDTQKHPTLAGYLVQIAHLWPSARAKFLAAGEASLKIHGRTAIFRIRQWA